MQDHPHWARRHERTRRRPEVVRRLMAEHVYQLKFVIDRPEDLDEAEAFLSDLPPVEPGRVLLMPQGVTEEELAGRSEWLQEHCRWRGFVFCPRKQIEWFGPVRGT